ncbi:MAG: DegT/DnrJ/EryC1/StrS family aminotransferase [Acidobacteriota bacterium]
MTPAVAHSVPFFPYPQAFLPEEEALVGIFRDVGRRGAFIEQRDLREFEASLARFLGARHAIGVANATDGLLIALRAAGVEPGTEVIFSSHTMVATAAAIHFAGAIPVPVECGADHLMDPVAAAAAVTPRTSAILPTQLNGRTSDMNALGRLASAHGLIVVEDAAQALGSRFDGRCAGTFGAAAAVSFFPAKLLGCLGDGGAVIANDEGVAERVRALHDHGRDGHGNVTGWGFNSRLDNLQAAILNYRLLRYDAVIARRRELARAYEADLEDVAEIVRPPAPDADRSHYDVYQNYEIEAERRDGLREFLTARGVGTLLPWGGKAVHQWDALGLPGRLPVTEKLFERVLLLPMNAWLTDDDVEIVAGSVREFYRGRS